MLVIVNFTKIMNSKAGPKNKPKKVSEIVLSKNIKMNTFREERVRNF